MIKVIGERCPQDHACAAIWVCPVDALTQIKNGLPIVDNEKYIECGKCVRVCPYQTFVIEEQ